MLGGRAQHALEKARAPLYEIYALDICGNTKQTLRLHVFSHSTSTVAGNTDQFLDALLCCAQQNVVMALHTFRGRAKARNVCETACENLFSMLLKSDTESKHERDIRDFLRPY